MPNARQVVKRLLDSILSYQSHRKNCKTQPPDTHPTAQAPRILRAKVNFTGTPCFTSATPFSAVRSNHTFVYHPHARLPRKPRVSVWACLIPVSSGIWLLTFAIVGRPHNTQVTIHNTYRFDGMMTIIRKEMRGG